MKNLHFKLLIVLAISFMLFNSCSKSDSPSNPKLVVYKNQTGDTNADALQAQCFGDNKEYTINMYGTFDASNNPYQMKTLTYQKANNDTIYHYMLDPVTSRIKSAFYAVNGIKSNIVLKFDYGTNPTDDINVSFFNYNWQNQTSQLLYATQVKNTNGTVTGNPYFAGKNANAWSLVNIAATFAATDVIVVGLGGTTTVLLSTTAAATLAAALAPAIGVVVVVVAIGVALNAGISSANASELSPADTPYPFNTAVNNPVPQTSDPTPNLQTSNCVNNDIVFAAAIDAAGTITFSALGGTAPYTYFIGSNRQSNPVFAYNYPNGTYDLAVKDANGCVRNQTVTLTCTDTQTETVTIGTQIWTIKNLDVDHYRNGDPIPQVTDPAQWATLTTGAWCYYNNDTANGPVYGKLYNWYAVNDPRGLAPIGYHVPTDSEWTILTDYLGGASIAREKLKDAGVLYWNSQLNLTAYASNSSGFTAIGCGWRYYSDGRFEGLNEAGNWWSANEFDASMAISRSIYNFSSTVYSGPMQKIYGFSVRCLRD
jgi:uncharacterized protein (TIGR02145 family)